MLRGDINVCFVPIPTAIDLPVTLLIRADEFHIGAHMPFHAAMTQGEFLVLAWRAANDKSREMGWIR